MRSYANSKLNGLWVTDNGDEYKPESEWDEDYFNQQMAMLPNNFSKKRFDHCVEVAKKVL